MRDKVREIQTAYEQVKLILSTYPNSRDSNRKLIAYFWRQENPKLFLEENRNPAYQVLVALANGQLTEPETITRARRKVQEENSHLRGKRYNERQDMSQDVKERIKGDSGVQTGMFDGDPNAKTKSKNQSYDN